MTCLLPSRGPADLAIGLSNQCLVFPSLVAFAAADRCILIDRLGERCSMRAGSACFAARDPSDCLNKRSVLVLSFGVEGFVGGERGMVGLTYLHPDDPRIVHVYRRNVGAFCSH